MVDWAVTPYQTIGVLKFDMTEAEVRTILGKPEKSLLLQQTAPHTADCYLSRGVFVHYDKDGKMEAVEFSGPDQITYNGKRLVHLSETEAEQWFARVDEDTQIDGDEFTSPKLGIAMYAPMGKVEAVMAFRRGYGEEPK